MHTFVAGEIVYVDDNTTMMFTIVHVHKTKAWIEPYCTTMQHNHVSVNGACYCERDHVITTNCLWLVPAAKH